MERQNWKNKIFGNFFFFVNAPNKKKNPPKFVNDFKCPTFRATVKS